MRRFIFSLMLLISFTCFTANAPTNASAASIRHAVPTLYLHGHHGNKRSMATLMRYAEHQDRAHAVITAFVSDKGRVRLAGRWPKETRRPLVKVVFRNRHTRKYHRISNWLRNVLLALKQRYGIRQFNVVAHSLGNAAVLYYELRYSHNRHFPQLNKYAAIAGNFDGVPGKHRHQHPNKILPNGRPKWLAPRYRYALKRQQQFKVRHVKILNIYGNLMNGSHSDGQILNASSRSLDYLIGRRVKAYREQEFFGPDAQHRRLRKNPNVAVAVDHFMW